MGLFEMVRKDEKETFIILQSFNFVELPETSSGQAVNSVLAGTN